MKPIDSLTPEELREIAESIGLANRFVLMKRGLYYRPNGHGYTDAIEAAWVLSSEEADKRVYPHDEPVTKHPAPLSAFDTDANAALTLGDALAGWEHDHWGNASEVRFSFYKEEETPNGDLVKGEEHEATATGPHAFPLALSRAYLAVIRSEEEQG